MREALKQIEKLHDESVRNNAIKNFGQLAGSTCITNSHADPITHEQCVCEGTMTISPGGQYLFCNKFVF